VVLVRERFELSLDSGWRTGQWKDVRKKRNAAVSLSLEDDLVALGIQY
jgi:hypothetical protein